MTPPDRSNFGAAGQEPINLGAPGHDPEMGSGRPDALDVAWAAGLFEGEGCFTAIRTDKSSNRYLRVALLTTDEDVLRRFHRIVGTGSITIEPRRHGTKMQWRWQVTRECDFRSIVRLFEPYLGNRRRSRAYELLNEFGRIHPEQLEAPIGDQGHG
jgi:hypothetical protein